MHHIMSRNHFRSSSTNLIPPVAHAVAMTVHILRNHRAGLGKVTTINSDLKGAT